MTIRNKMTFEKRGDQLLPWNLFLSRMATVGLLTLATVSIALLMGIAGYRFIAGLSWMDALLNASMILTGMGPVSPMRDNAAKIFASAYALFSGVIFLSSIGVLFSPIFHRILHHFHIEDEEK
jgi:hypothetical protein